MILLYEIDKLPGWPALQTAMAMKQETYRLVQPGEYHLTLGQLAAGEKTGPGLPPAPLTEPMMIFCGMDQDELTEFLALNRRLGGPQIALKAMLTPTNRTWTTKQLFEELKDEHAYFQKH